MQLNRMLALIVCGVIFLGAARASATVTFNIEDVTIGYSATETQFGQLKIWISHDESPDPAITFWQTVIELLEGNDNIRFTSATFLDNFTLTDSMVYDYVFASTSNFTWGLSSVNGETDNLISASDFASSTSVSSISGLLLIDFEVDAGTNGLFDVVFSTANGGSFFDAAPPDAFNVGSINVLPEPTSLALVGLGALALMRRRPHAV